MPRLRRRRGAEREGGRTDAGTGIVDGVDIHRLGPGIVGTKVNDPILPTVVVQSPTNAGRLVADMV